jgi:parvulin-like peptidyl-prolyl isomerase
VDRVAAVVNNRVITLSDVQWSFVNRQKASPTGAEEQRKAMDDALNQLIEQELVSQEVEKEPLFTVREEDVENELRKLEQRYGSRAQLEAELKRSGLSMEQLHSNIRRQLSVVKFIDVRFRPFVIVLPDEITAYYRETLVPELKKQGIENPPSIENLSAQIEATLIEQKVDQELEKWLSNVRKRAKIVILLFREKSSNVPPPELLKDNQKKPPR